MIEVVAPATVSDLLTDGAVAAALEELASADVAIPRLVGPGERPDCCLVLASGAHGDLVDARRLVAAAVAVSEVVAFCAPLPVDHEHGRWPHVWDALFAEHGYEPADVVRARLWDDIEVDPVFVQGSTVYAPPAVASRLRTAGSSALPRAVVHPARLAQFARAHVSRSRLDRAEQERAVAERQAAEARQVAHLAALDLDRLHRELDDARLRVVVAEAAGAAAPEGHGPPAPTQVAAGPRPRRRPAAPVAIAAPPRFGGARRAVADVVASLTATDDQVRALVEPSWYLARYPEVGPAGIAPRVHFAKYGVPERRDPCRWFDSAHYLAANPDVATSNVPPVVHYLTSGWREGRDPHPWFSGAHYLTRNGDVAAAGINPLLHFVVTGAREGRSPHPLLDPETCAAEARRKGIVVADPCGWWIDRGWEHGASPHWLFSVPWYRHHSPDVSAVGVDPLRHYLEHGWAEHRSPHPVFDPGWYLTTYPDVAAAGMEPLTHYVTAGRFESRRPSAVFDPVWYAVEAGAALGGVEPCEHYLTVGRRAGLTPSRWAADLHLVASGR